VKSITEPGMYADGAGLYLRVSEGGNKSWIFRFKQKRADGKFVARDMGLGGYPEVSLAEARDLAKEAREHHQAGRDPIQQRKDDKARAIAQQRAAEAQGITFRQFANQWIENNKAAWKNARHQAQWVKTFEDYVYPVIGDKAVSAVDTDDVLKVLEPIWNTKTVTASRVRGRMEKVLAAAKALKLRTDNPALWRGHLDTLLQPKSKLHTVKHFTAMPYKDVPAFMARLRAKQGVTARALEFTILTAARTKEAREARFDEFDLDAKVWSIPAERMKRGRKHSVPLCDRAVAIVKEMADRRRKFVFPGRDPSESLSDTVMFGLLCDLCPDNGLTVHGMRSSFRDWVGEETDFAHDICEAALAHAIGGDEKTRLADQRGELLEKRRGLMEAWAGYCGPQSPARKPAPRTKVKTANGADLVARRHEAGYEMHDSGAISCAGDTARRA